MEDLVIEQLLNNLQDKATPEVIMSIASLSHLSHQHQKQIFDTLNTLTLQDKAVLDLVSRNTYAHETLRHPWTDALNQVKPIRDHFSNINFVEPLVIEEAQEYKVLLSNPTTDLVLDNIDTYYKGEYMRYRAHLTLETKETNISLLVNFNLEVTDEAWSLDVLRRAIQENLWSNIFMSVPLFSQSEKVCELDQDKRIKLRDGIKTVFSVYTSENRINLLAESVASLRSKMLDSILPSIRVGDTVPDEIVEMICMLSKVSTSVTEMLNAFVVLGGTKTKGRNLLIVRENDRWVRATTAHTSFKHFKLAQKLGSS